MSEEEPPRGLFPPAFWIAMGMGLALVLAGAVVGLLGPRWLAHPPQAAPAASRALTAP